MGQAFDVDGNVLAEVFGETKREVFDKLIEEHPHAAEIRIETLNAKPGLITGTTETLRPDQLTLPTTDMLPLDPLLQFFTHDHLPPRLSMASKLFCDLARQIVATLPRNSERTVALRKLLEAKDSAVRAVIAVVANVSSNKG